MKAIIVYATESGNTQAVAEMLKKELSGAGNSVNVYRLGQDGYSPKLDDYELILLGSPTYYNGQLQTEMATFVAKFAGSLQSYKIAVFSLGDSGFAEFCRSAEILESWVADKGGAVLCPSLKIDGYPQQKPVAEWAKKVLEALT